MSEHYYSKTPTSESNERCFECEIQGQRLKFIYDNGVFSKGELDEGTRILISALENIHGDILDLGCGWGAIGVYLGSVHADARISMSDVNERALALAAKNLRLNGITNARTLLSDGFENIEGSFNYIITNPPIRAGKQTIYRLFDEAMGHLKPDGALYIVIRKQQGAESALKHIQGARVILKKKGFWVLLCQKSVAQGDKNDKLAEEDANVK